MPANRSRSAYVSIPPNARPPPDSPHRGLDNDVLISPPSDGVSESLRRGAHNTSVPLTRSRSAQDLMGPPNNSPYSLNRGDNHVPPSSRHSTHQPSRTLGITTLGITNNHELGVPVPSLPSYQGYLSVPDGRHPRHQYSRSSDNIASTLPFNTSETSLGTCAELADLHVRDQSTFEQATARTTSRSALSEQEYQQELLQNGILKFQEGTLAEQDQEWHQLVSEDFRLSLSKSEIERQSTIFELIKSEKDYVEDLELVDLVFIRPLMMARPPVITPETRLRTFRSEIFQNIADIAARQRSSLVALYARQKEQHPLISSIADIELDAALSLRNDYEAYIKQYPIAEGRHRRELKSNQAYAGFIHTVSRDPRLRRRDLITFISRPVTRLPRLSLILEHINKLTDPDHPDIETMPLTLTILSDFLKSTQVGIAVADAKVKFWELCESLVYRPGEIIDMDLYDAQRHLVSTGVVACRNKTDFGWHGWRDVNLSLLDNYLLITSPEVRLGRTLHVLISRPIPLECLGLGSFKDPPENRREESEGGSRLLDTLMKPTKPVHPFTIFHKLDFRRRYTFYAQSEASRLKWYDTLVDAIGVRKAHLDANRWYVPDILDDGTFRARTAKVPLHSHKDFSGRIVSATTFSDRGRNYIVVACVKGLYAASHASSREFKKVLSLERVSSVVSLSGYGKLVLLQDGTLRSYSLRALIGIINGTHAIESFSGSMRLLARDEHVLFFEVGEMDGHTLVVYVAKGFRHTSVHVLRAFSRVPTVEAVQQHGETDAMATFRPYGSPFNIPRDTYSVTFLQKYLAIATSNGIAIVHPAVPNLEILMFPDWEAPSDASPQAHTVLKSRCHDARLLGLMQAGDSQLLIVYESFGCYITKYGVPTRKCGFVHWETNVQSFVSHGQHVLLIGQTSIEVRFAATGWLLHIIEGNEIRLVQNMPPGSGPTLFARQGQKNDTEGLSDELLELLETLPVVAPPTDSSIMWEEWD